MKESLKKYQIFINDNSLNGDGLIEVNTEIRGQVRARFNIGSYTT